MNSIIGEHNSSKYSTTGKAPDLSNPPYETNWMNKKHNEIYKKELIGFPEGSMVKFLNEEAFTTKRMNYSKDAITPIREMHVNILLRQHIRVLDEIQFTN
jgi:hypothetical protein